MLIELSFGGIINYVSEINHFATLPPIIAGTFGFGKVKAFLLGSPKKPVDETLIQNLGVFKYLFELAGMGLSMRVTVHNLGTPARGIVSLFGGGFFRSPKENRGKFLGDSEEAGEHPKCGFNQMKGFI